MDKCKSSQNNYKNVAVQTMNLVTKFFIFISTNYDEYIIKVISLVDSCKVRSF